MSVLLLRVDQYLDGDELPPALYAELSGPGIQGARSLMLPAGAGDAWHEEMVGPGQFLVQVTLPSGEVLSHDIDVPADVHEPLRVPITPEASAHEHLAWPQLLGSVDSDLAVTAYRARHPLAGDMSRHVGDEPVLGGTATREGLEAKLRLELHQLADVTGELSVTPLPPGAPVWIKQTAQQRDIPAMSYNLWHDLDEESLVVRFMPDGVLEGGVEGRGRLFLKLAGVPGGPWVATLPLPWYATVEADRPPARVDILLHRPGLAPGAPPRLSVIVRDELVSLLLGYLGHDQLTALRAIRDTSLKDAELLLYRKIANPYAAAAGALVLIRTGAYERLHNWPKNLANWFQWLPDGSVIHGWCCLLGVHEGHRRAPDLTTAQARLLEATARGVPVYTEALKLLIDGLKRVELLAAARGEPTEEITAALKRMRGYAAAVDWRQPFTLFRGENPLQPESSVEQQL